MPQITKYQINQIYLDCTKYCKDIICKNLVAMLGLVVALGCVLGSPPASRPHIVFILADDVGLGDVG